MNSLNVALIAAAGFGAGWQASGLVDRATIRRDQAVIEAGLGGFFEKAEWNWIYHKGDFVAIRPEWSDRRPSIYALIERGLGFHKRSSKSKAKYDELVRFRSKVVRDLGDFTPGPVPPITRLALGKRLFVGAFDVRPGSFIPGEYSSSQPNAPSGTARALVSIGPPDYSKGGRYAAFEAYESSNHGAAFTFFLERQGSSWKVVHVAAVYYA